MGAHIKNTEAGKRERRRFFRVDDVLPVAITRLGKDWGGAKAKLIPGLSGDLVNSNAAFEVPDERINPHLWRMLVEINNKLSLLVEDMAMTKQGFPRAETKRVSLSASGILMRIHDQFSLGDLVEVKMLLVGGSSCWVVLYGEVTRAKAVGEGEIEIGVEFAEMGDEVRNALSVYTIIRQREILRGRSWNEE